MLIDAHTIARYRLSATQYPMPAPSQTPRLPISQALLARRFSSSSDMRTRPTNPSPSRHAPSHPLHPIETLHKHIYQFLSQELDDPWTREI